MSSQSPPWVFPHALNHRRERLAKKAARSDAACQFASPHGFEEAPTPLPIGRGSAAYKATRLTVPASLGWTGPTRSMKDNAAIDHLRLARDGVRTTERHDLLRHIVEIGRALQNRLFLQHGDSIRS